MERRLICTGKGNLLVVVLIFPCWLLFDMPQNISVLLAFTFSFRKREHSYILQALLFLWLSCWVCRNRMFHRVVCCLLFKWLALRTGWLSLVSVNWSKLRIALTARMEWRNTFTLHWDSVEGVSFHDMNVMHPQELDFFVYWECYGSNYRGILRSQDRILP